jgi:hypothetical protein
MKAAVRRLLRRLGGAVGLDELRHDVLRGTSESAGAARAMQLLLRMRYRDMVACGAPLPGFGDVELRAFSQNGEDGILLYLFSVLGEPTRRCIEIGAGDGTQCNTANLIINHGWDWLLVEADPKRVEAGRAFFATHPDTAVYPPKLVHARVTPASVDALLERNGFAGDVDLLSLDIDGIDYWVWEAMNAARPRIVVAEVQVIWGDERAVSVPYTPDFVPGFVDGFGVYSGASLPAFVALGRRKGYRLIGAQRYGVPYLPHHEDPARRPRRLGRGFNAFFARDDFGREVFPEVPASACLQHPFVGWARERFLPLVRDRVWVDV